MILSSKSWCFKLLGTVSVITESILNGSTVSFEEFVRNLGEENRRNINHRFSFLQIRQNIEFTPRNIQYSINKSI